MKDPETMRPDTMPITHPLMRAARALNDTADFEGTLQSLGMETDARGLVYLAEQRALRAVAAVDDGRNLGLDPEADEAYVRELIGGERWKAVRDVLVAAYIDGMSIGWAGHQYAQGADTRFADGMLRVHAVLPDIKH